MFNPLELNVTLPKIEKTIATFSLPDGKSYVLVTDECASQNAATSTSKQCIPKIDIYSRKNGKYVPIKSISIFKNDEKIGYLSDHPTTPALTCNDKNSWICYIAWFYWHDEGYVNDKQEKPYYSDIKLLKFNQDGRIGEIVTLSNINKYMGGGSKIPLDCINNCMSENESLETLCQDSESAFVETYNYAYLLSLSINNGDVLISTPILSYIVSTNTILILNYYILFNEILAFKKTSYFSCEEIALNTNLQGSIISRNSLLQDISPLIMPFTKSTSILNNSLMASYNNSENRIYIDFLNQSSLEKKSYELMSHDLLGRRKNLKFINYKSRVILASEWQNFAYPQFYYDTALTEIVFNCDGLNQCSILKVNEFETSGFVWRTPSSDNNENEYHCINPGLAISSNGTLIENCERYNLLTKNFLGIHARKYSLVDSNSFIKINETTFYYDNISLPDFDHATLGGSSSTVYLKEDDRFIFNYVDKNGIVKSEPFWETRPSENISPSRPGYINVEIFIFVLVIGIIVYFRKELLFYFDKKDKKRQGYLEIENNDLEMGDVSQKISLHNLIFGEREYELFGHQQVAFIKVFVNEFENTLNFYNMLIREDAVLRGCKSSEEFLEMVKNMADRTNLELGGYIFPFKISIPPFLLIDTIWNIISKYKQNNHRKEAGKISDYFDEMTLEERTTIIYNSAKFLAKRYFESLNNKAKTNKYQKKLAVRSVKRIFEYLLEDPSWILSIFGNQKIKSYQQENNPFLFVENRIKEAFTVYTNSNDAILEPQNFIDEHGNKYGNPERLVFVYGDATEAQSKRMKKFGKTTPEDREIYKYFLKFMEKDARTHLNKAITEKDERVTETLVEATSKALRMTGFRNYLLPHDLDQGSAKPETQKHYIDYSTTSEHIKKGMIMEEFIIALSLLMPKNCSKTHSDTRVTDESEQKIRFLNMFAKTFYETYNFYVCLEMGTFASDKEVEREKRIAVIKCAVSAMFPTINISASDLGYKLPLSISLPTGAAVVAIISLCNFFYKNRNKNTIRNIAQFFGEENNKIENRVEMMYKIKAIYDCAEFLANIYSKHIMLLDVDGAELFAQLLAARIFIYIGKYKYEKEGIKRNTAAQPLRDVATRVIERAIEKEDKRKKDEQSPFSIASSILFPIKKEKNRYPGENSPLTRIDSTGIKFIDIITNNCISKSPDEYKQNHLDMR